MISFPFTSNWEFRIDLVLSGHQRNWFAWTPKAKQCKHGSDQNKAVYNLGKSYFIHPFFLFCKSAACPHAVVAHSLYSHRRKLHASEENIPQLLMLTEGHVRDDLPSVMPPKKNIACAFFTGPWGCAALEMLNRRSLQ